MLLPINKLFHIDHKISMSKDNSNEKKYNCQCGEAFSSVEELNEHNHKAH